MLSKEEIKCCKCDSDYEENYYKYKNNIFCFDCLTEQLENERILIIVNTISYYNDDWQELGTSDDYDRAIQNICEEYEVKEIENEFK